MPFYVLPQEMFSLEARHVLALLNPHPSVWTEGKCCALENNPRMLLPRHYCGAVTSGGARLGHPCRRPALDPLSTHRPASLVVVSVHGRAGIRPVLSGICKFPGHQHAKIGILAAPPPFPAISWRSFVVGVTAADRGRALGTGAGYSKGHSCGGDGMDKGRLSRGWE